MGNICSSSKNEPEAFSAPGRVLGSSTANNTAPRVSVPAGAKSKQSPWKSPGRTLGGGGSGGGSAAAGSSTGPGPGTETAEDARARAAAAAQARVEAKTAKGKLGTKLAAQKAQTQSQTLNEVSRGERAARDADGAEAARRWE
ncbi:hypothetical protein BJX66DRAFT_307576 [Aspergillus keveii]|uniref:Uncharacterized protein n=1 Tax=Aspergillus keveii TaxID=714993 RepID=A0ABR4G0E1_9EURO